MSLKTPLEMFYHWEETVPETIYLRQPIDGLVKDFHLARSGRPSQKGRCAFASNEFTNWKSYRYFI